ncbi:hypothetical protein O6H91_05G124700 [Diphasiastrum complanatum]|uniref:Uncharacterized protein n=5 Tax=Diphasiastrum complanatum TaxID=34168 RepID=A0ACC2DT39_DIPCM|nr:hypothetical protein O6H91_05G124700 [Diphasiastrum complanatum]KAJ7557386.1 hypothetical protein O6H91_05G124700 [Diphasiastrum complanatum]KAJ7557387.1 hypothetical protein O6H91_05G124700 [Diphasiastrum complanatum]KAJ7557390.1 hypothetical protein O6H91_05G124700 [Diphasiastrum complanatum]KAJ7557391.1 hypothetical protein O6H91_05G124700 [Diphasiastrum complanatum]
MEGSEGDVTVSLVNHRVDLPEEPDADLQNEESFQHGDKTSYNNVPEPDLGFESLDYDPIFNLVFENSRKDLQSRQLYGYTGLTLAKWSITILIGILVGLVAYLIEMCQEFLLTRKKELTQRIMVNGLMLSFIGFASFSVLLVLVACCLVLFWAPSAGGGGVTLVMAYLNGTDIPEFFQFKTLVTKIIGSICTISSGLMLGQEGPMVHIGAAIASLMTWIHGALPTRKKTQPSHLRRCCKPWQAKALPFDLYSDKDRREFISAGTAAGLAAAFGAPIGGVLYSLEEASSFWSRKVMWRSLICCTFATMVLALVNSWEFSTSLPGSMSFREVQPVFIVRDLPLFLVTSALTSILGVVINSAHAWLAHMRPSSSYKVLRIIEACFVTLISVTVMFVLPLCFGQCMEVPAQKTPSGTMDRHYWFRYTCPAPNTTAGVHYYNDLATLFFSLPRQNMQELYGMHGDAETEFSIRSLGIHSLSALVLFILAYGIATPGGVFMPAMLVGASFGGFLGRIFQRLLPSAHVQPGLHALVGTAAMLGGFLRASISLVVITVEGFGGVDFILPLIVAIVVSNWVAYHFHDAGAYEADLERIAGVCFLQSEPPRELIAFSAADLMSSNVVCFHEVVTVAEVLKVLQTRRHNGFPVLRHTHSDTSNGGGKFVGLILRHQLLLLLEERAFVEIDPQVLLHTQKYAWENNFSTNMQFLDHAMRIYHHFHYPHHRYLSSRPEALADLGVDEIVGAVNSSNSKPGNVSDDINTTADAPKKVLALDLRPFMNRAPITVRRECSAQRVYIIFRTLGLRHLCVTDSHNKVIGIITRKDIAMAQKQGRLSKDKRFQHWDSDIRSFNEQKDRRQPRRKLYDLP